MTDCQDPETEQGSNLPLPPGIDGEETNEPQVESELESPSTLAEKVLAEAQKALADSCDVRRGDYLFGGPDLDPEIEYGHAGSEGEVDGRRIMDEIPAPSPEQLDTFNSLVTQATLSADVSDGLKLPWEQGIFKTIFDDAPLWGLPEIPQISQSTCGQYPEPEEPEIDYPYPEPRAKVARTSRVGHGLYDRAISFGLTLTDQEIDKNKWARSLEKLYTLFTVNSSSCPESLKLVADDMEQNLARIRHLCGLKSSGTILKRANSLLRYVAWHRSFYYQRQPFPFVPQEISEYIWEKFQDGVSYSSLSSFVEAVNFAIHVLGMPALTRGKPLVDQFTKGILDRAALQRPGRKQARPLTVQEVSYLESCLKNAEMNLFDRYAAGSFLFAIYARCRWSDMRAVNSFDFDVSTEENHVHGFLGFTTFNHKTASQVARHGLPLPLVAPIWGLEAPAWGLMWKKVAREAGVNFNEAFAGPVLPAPLKNGTWGSRSVGSSEASKWLLALLNKVSDNLETVSSHSLKCTTLSWLAKAGADEAHRLVLGHHSSGRGSLEIYSRDMLAAPLRTLEGVLRQIRVGALQPDRTRSGIIQKPTRDDCRDTDPQNSGTEERPGREASSSSSSSSTSSSDSDSADNESDAEDQIGHWAKLSQDNKHQQSWGIRTMYQHKLSKVVHLEADSEKRQFECGIIASHEHEIVTQTLFLETRKCKRCQKAVGEA